jgi:DNA-binding transcriptional ArsR family regulator
MTNPTDALLTALATPRRRRVLSLLTNRSEEIDETSLAELIASAETGKPRRAVTEKERDRVRTDLHHVHLPALVDGEIVERDDDGSVTLAAWSLLDRGRVRRVLDDPESVTETEERVFDALSHPRRRRILSTLRDSRGPRSLEDLGRSLVESGAFGDAEDAVVSLHHVHLPRLAEADLVEWDAESETVSRSEFSDHDGDRPGETTAPLEFGRGGGTMVGVEVDD